mgnify:CR=1 FL=1
MGDLNLLQTNIMIFVGQWADKNKTPVAQRSIIEEMGIQGVKSFTALNAINALLKKGYIRKAYSEQKNKTFYVMIRTI